MVERIVHLPLFISTYDLVSNVYCNTKSTHPCFKSVCEVAENGVKSITSAAFHSALPIIGKLEPQSKLKGCLQVTIRSDFSVNMYLLKVSVSL